MGLDRIARMVAQVGTPTAWVIAVIMIVMHALAGEIFAVGAATAGTTTLSVQHYFRLLTGDKSDRSLLMKATADAVATVRRGR
jgi:hypothetical protein